LKGVAIDPPHNDCRPVVFVTDKRPGSGTVCGALGSAVQRHAGRPV